MIPQVTQVALLILQWLCRVFLLLLSPRRRHVGLISRLAHSCLADILVQVVVRHVLKVGTAGTFYTQASIRKGARLLIVRGGGAPPGGLDC